MYSLWTKECLMLWLKKTRILWMMDALKARYFKKTSTVIRNINEITSPSVIFLLLLCKPKDQNTTGCLYTISNPRLSFKSRRRRIQHRVIIVILHYFLLYYRNKSVCCTLNRNFSLISSTWFCFSWATKLIFP